MAPLPRMQSRQSSPPVRRSKEPRMTDQRDEAGLAAYVEILIEQVGAL
jgi:hypothetical protein